jgi:hypothetical protein
VGRDSKRKKKERKVAGGKCKGKMYAKKKKHTQKTCSINKFVVLLGDIALRKIKQLRPFTVFLFFHTVLPHPPLSQKLS